MASVIFVLWCISLPSTHAYLCELSRHLGVQQASAGISFILLEVLLFTGQSFHPFVHESQLIFEFTVFMSLPRSLLSSTFKRRIYHRTHISHMRIDRMRSLMRQHGTPSIFLFPHLNIPSFFWLPKSSSSSRSAPTSTFTPRPFFGHVTSPFIPVRLTGGGNTHQPFGQDTDMVDVFSAEETTSACLLFNPDEWIGNGKLWSATLPPHVQLAFADVQSIPAWMLDFIPQSQVSVSDLQATALPSSTSPSITLLPSTSSPTIFVNTASLDNLLDHPIFFGGKAALAALDQVGLEQAWLSGCKSIVFSGYPDRYPLWTRKFVEEIHIYRTDRARWESAQKWLEATALVQSDSTPVETPDIVDECRTRLTAVPWRGDITGFGKGVQFTARHLALFLSNEWLDDEMINAGSDWILSQVGASRRTEIVNCLHIQILRHAHTAQIPYVPRTRLDHLISTCNVDILFLPLHVFGNHWTLLQVNLSDATYSYADCLHHEISPPPLTLDLVQWWITSLSPHIPHLKLVPFNFDLPRQRDGFSCGIIVLDLMAAILLQHSIWNPQSAAVRRMEWFLRLSADFGALSEVCLHFSR